MNCIRCGKNIDDSGQDNMSSIPGLPLCEDCYFANGDIKEWETENDYENER